MLELRSGGWVLLLAGVLMVAIGAWHGAQILRNYSKRATGDGRTLASYGYDLSTLLVPRDKLRPIGIDLRKDGMPALDHPPRTAGAALGPGIKLGGVRKLLSSERVIGVALGGEAVAYPLWILDWHEIVNDTVGGRPVVVTYNGICDSAVVFDRDVGGQVRAFGFSGLLYNANLVLYDRQDDPRRESLWSQLQMRAIAGPAAAAGLTLRVVPFELTTWAHWRAAHSETQVILPNPARKLLYKRDAYSTYRNSDTLKFLADPLPHDGRAYKTPIVVVCGDDGRWHEAKPDQFIRPDRPRIYTYWFAWYATHHDLGTDH